MLQQVFSLGKGNVGAQLAHLGQHRLSVRVPLARLHLGLCPAERPVVNISLVRVVHVVDGIAA